MCERNDVPVPRLEKRGGYSGSRPGWTMGPPARIPSGSSAAVEAAKAKPKKDT